MGIAVDLNQFVELVSLGGHGSGAGSHAVFGGVEEKVK